MPRESAIQTRIARELRARGCYVAIQHGSPYSTRGQPDMLVCAPGGKFVALEVKQPGKGATKLQALTLARIAAAGGVARVVSSVSEALAACGVSGAIPGC